MREILFRGQTRRKGEKVRLDGTPVDSHWVYGGVSQNRGIIYQVDPDIDKFPVYPDTVGQCTGKNDLNGQRIFEGDIVRYGDKLYTVKWAEKYMRFAFMRKDVVMAMFLPEACVVVGNVYDNPEMMEE